MKFDNSYIRLPDHFYAKVSPARAPAPKLLAWNARLAETLDLSELATSDEALAEMFSGNTLPSGSEPIALAYAGHQFANFVPQLGDGRALLLGEVVDRDGHRYDVQLKGSGVTPFSRGGDGRSALGPVIREYVLSEAMATFGVPTTRALAAVQTGETVFREGALPGGVFTRVAASHIRIGTFQYFAARGDLDALRSLADYAIERHYPEAADSDEPILELFSGVLRAQADLVAHWMDLGFIHGVMNTDNMTISGETIDYGPCAFMDEFSRSKVFSSIDRRGRYAYQNQPGIAQWNLARLAECLLLLKDDLPAFEERLGEFPERYQATYLSRMRHKLGLRDEREGDSALIEQWLDHLQEHELDYTLSYRALADTLIDDAQDEPTFGAFERAWRDRLDAQGNDVADVRRDMNSVNPLFIPRNHRVEEAIQGAVRGDLTVFHELREVLRQPFDAQPDFARYADAPLPEERVLQTFCGT